MSRSCSACSELVPEGARHCPACGVAAVGGGDVFGLPTVLPGARGEAANDARTRATSRFEFLERLGTGGMGEVWSARDLRLNEVVAVKVILPDRAESEAVRRRFLEEVRQSRRLRHENIVAVHDLHEDGERLLLVMEQLQGVTLREHLDELRARRRSMAIEDAAAIVTQAARGLEQAHAMGIVHRDVKPENLFLVGATAGAAAGSVHVKVLDFGLAKDAKAEAGSLSRLGLGTPWYVAPEQAAGREVDARADVYSLAVVLWECLTGEVPTQIEPPSRLRPGLATGWDDVVARATARRPEDRTGSVQEFGRQVAAAPRRSTEQRVPAASSQPAQPVARPREPAPSPAAVQPSAKSPAIRRGIVGLAVVVGLALAVYVAGVLADAGAPVAAHEPKSESVLPAAQDVPVVAATKEGVRAVAGHRGLGRNAQGSDVYERTKDGARVILVAGGVFEMGSTSGGPDEKPVHEVELSAYLLDEREVTWGQYRRVKGSTPAKPEWNPAEDHPVVNVTWDEAGEYCEAVGGRLPTEAEWELAARGKEGREYPWGEGAPGREQAVWKRTLEEGTEAVGSRPAGAGPYGHLDLAGNAWEWVWDWWVDYPSGWVKDPKGPTTGERRVLRGGSFDVDAPHHLRGAYRVDGHPSGRAYALGFRCAQDVP